MSEPIATVEKMPPNVQEILRLRARVAELEADLREAKGWVDAALRAAVRDVLQRCNDNGGEIDAELVAELKAALGESEVMPNQQSGSPSTASGGTCADNARPRPAHPEHLSKEPAGADYWTDIKDSDSDLPTAEDVRGILPRSAHPEVIPCPNCNGGWRREAGRPTDWEECVVCETRGVLVIDVTKTLALPAQAKPK